MYMYTYIYIDVIHIHIYLYIYAHTHIYIHTSCMYIWRAAGSILAGGERSLLAVQEYAHCAHADARQQWCVV